MRFKQYIQESKDFVNTKSPLTSAELKSKLDAILEKLNKDGQKMTTKNSMVPSAPDTSKFMAHRSGAISLENNVTIHGAYNSSVTYNRFLKIGGGISMENSQALKKEFFAELAKYADEVANENTHIMCADGKNISVRSTYGTNWGGLGYRIG